MQIIDARYRARTADIQAYYIASTRSPKVVGTQHTGSQAHNSTAQAYRAGRWKGAVEQRREEQGVGRPHLGLVEGGDEDLWTQ